MIGRSAEITSRQGAKTTVLGLLLAVAVFLVYARTVNGPFLFDDIPYVVDRPHSHLPDLSWQSISELLTVRISQPHRWLSHLSFALNFYLFGDAPRSFHVTNIVIHLLTVVGVFLLCRRVMLRLGFTSERALLGALASAALFALHPIQTQAVSYIWQRTASLVTLWTVWSVWLFAAGRVRGLGRGWWLYALSAVFVAAAVATKQNGILVPFLMLLVHFVFFSKRDRSSVAWHGAVLAGAIAVGLIGATILWSSWGWSGLLDYSRRDFSLSERLLTQGRVMWRYVVLLAFPHPGLLNIDHHVIPSEGLLKPWTTLPSLLGVIAAVGFSAWSVFRWPGVGFGLLWYWACHVPEGTIIPLEQMFEHRCYMPLVGLSVVAGMGFEAAHRRWRPLAWAALGLICVSYGAGTYVRNGVYLDAETLWRDAVAKSPDKARPYNNLARIARDAGRLAEAERLYRESLRLNPNDVGTYNYLGILLASAGRPAEAVELYRTSLKMDPTAHGVYHNLGLSLSALGRYDEALAAFREAVRLKPDFADAHHSIGNTLAAMGDLPGAAGAFREALRHNPELAGSYTNLGTVLIQLGQHAQARELLETGARRLSDEPMVQNSLARLLIACPDPTFRDAARGIAIAQGALARLDRPDALLLVTVAMGRAEQGDFPEAARVAGRALQAAASAGNNRLASQIQVMIRAYRQGRRPDARPAPGR